MGAHIGFTEVWDIYLPGGGGFIWICQNGCEAFITLSQIYAVKYTYRDAVNSYSTGVLQGLTKTDAHRSLNSLFCKLQ